MRAITRQAGPASHSNRGWTGAIYAAATGVAIHVLKVAQRRLGFPAGSKIKGGSNE